ncbi:MAG: DinB family protein [Acidobacteriota bacterium]|jgi:uncharacterized damage-inducible protein DinB|nr:MAG: DinB family protein [Acidobacteriota bacterium]
MRLAAICSVLALTATACAAPLPPASEPAPPSTAIRDSLKGAYDMIQNNITRAAEQVPENLYSYRATPEVRTLGQLFAHIADASFSICSAVSGESRPEGSIEETRTTKADVQQALDEAAEFCGRAFEAVDDASGADAVTLFGALPTTKLGALAFNNAHNMEHYGNIVTYMRLNKMVPPSSQQ